MMNAKIKETVIQKRIIDDKQKAFKGHMNQKNMTVITEATSGTGDGLMMLVLAIQLSNTFVKYLNKG